MRGVKRRPDQAEDVQKVLRQFIVHRGLAPSRPCPQESVLHAQILLVLDEISSGHYHANHIHMLAHVLNSFSCLL
jgi:hypothetical protein